jgi:hypothetical protein
LGNVVGKEFQSDKATEGSVLGLVDNTHASAPEFLDDAVMRDILSDHWGKSYVAERG